MCEALEWVGLIIINESMISATTMKPEGKAVLRQCQGDACRSSWINRFAKFAGLTASLGLFVGSVAVVASQQNFDVYCTRNGDATTTCVGWEGNMNLTCVSNSGRTMSCRSTNGSSFVCVDSVGTTSCVNPSIQSRQSSTDCVLEGGGTASCRQVVDDVSPALPSPNLQAPSLRTDELISPELSLPSSVFE